MPAHRFKVGDIVRFKEQPGTRHPLYVGRDNQPVVITSIDNDTRHQYAFLLHQILFIDGWEGVAFARELEPIES